MITPLDACSLLFIGLLGACVGSFLNVVIYRLPANLSLVSPPSRCPKCMHPLAWYDNVPVLGWLWLRGKCRYCHEPISARYPLVELATAILFVGYVWAIYFGQLGPIILIDVTTPADLMPRPLQVLALYPWQQWPAVAGNLWVLATLVAAGLIDYDTYTVIPAKCFLAAVVGLVLVAIGGIWWLPPISAIGAPLIQVGSGPLVSLGWSAAAAGLLAAVGTSIGWLVMDVGYALGFIRPSFPTGEPTLQIDAATGGTQIFTSAAEIRWEVLREVPWLAVPAFGCLAALLVGSHVRAIGTFAQSAVDHFWVAQLAGAVLGMWIGAATVWLVRILGTLAFGRVAMGLGDVHLMLPIGVVCGPICGPAVLFIGAVCGLGLSITLWLLKGTREVSFGQYLSIGCLVCLLFRGRIEHWLGPGTDAVVSRLMQALGY